jgi:hypothetical protein
MSHDDQNPLSTASYEINSEGQQTQALPRSGGRRLRKIAVLVATIGVIAAVVIRVQDSAAASRRRDFAKLLAASDPTNDPIERKPDAGVWKPGPLPAALADGASTADRVRHAALVTAATRTYSFETAWTIDFSTYRASKDLPKPEARRIKGSLDFDRRQAEITMDDTVLKLVDGTGYMKIGGNPRLDGKWISLHQDVRMDNVGYRKSPVWWVDALSGLDLAALTVVGEEQLADAPALHVRVPISLGALLKATGPGVVEKLTSGDPVLDLWIDQADHIRRISFFGTTSLWNVESVVEINDFDRPLSPVAPPETATVISEFQAGRVSSRSFNVTTFYGD